MKTHLKYAISIIFSITLTACGGGGGGGSSGGGGGGGGGGTSATQLSDTINIGNITPIPIVSGSSTSTSLVVTNNSINELTLQGATMTQNGGVSVAVNPAMVNTSRCSILAATETCNVSINAPRVSGNFLLTMRFKDSANKTYTASQIITYSDQIPAQNGFVMSAINTNLVKTIADKSTLAIPFVLTENYSNVTLELPQNSGITSSISCPGNSFTAGNMCTAFINAANVGSQNLINMTANFIGENPTAPASAQSVDENDTAKALVSENIVANIPFVIIQNQVGNLLTSGVNLAIQPADGNHPQTILVLNSGLSPATSITATLGSSTQLVISNNTCGASLAAQSFCSFQLNVKTPLPTQNGQEPVNISYNNGVNLQGLGFNVSYLVNSSMPLLTMLLGSGSLQLSIVGTTVNLTVSVQNSGNVLLTNLSFTNVTGLNSAMSYDTVASTCNTTGTQNLDVGASCTLVIKYNPLAAETGGFQISEKGSYIDQNGQSQYYTGSSVNTLFSSILSYALLTLSPNNFVFNLLADTLSTVTQTFTILNSGNAATQGIPTIPALNVSGLSGGLVKSNTCTTALAANASCTITVTFGPLSTALNNATGNLLVNYQAIPGGPTESASANLAFNSSLTSLIKVANISFLGGLSGLGSLLSPYQFINSPLNLVTAIITYANTGTAAATNFNLNVSNLPAGFNVNSGTGTTCGYGINTITLASGGGTCTLSISGISQTGILTNPYAFTGPINISIPGWTYNDAALDVVQQTTPIYNAINSNIVSLVSSSFANVTENTTITSSGIIGSLIYNITAKFTATSATAAALPITISMQNLGSSIVGLLGAPTTCQITTSGGNCTINMITILGIPLGPNLLNYLISPNGAPSSGILSGFAINLQ